MKTRNAAKVLTAIEPRRRASREMLRAALFRVALIVLMTVLTYLPALRNGFVWDDDSYVTENPHLRTVHGLWTIWSSPRSNVQYYPLVFTTFWIEYHLWQSDTALGYHLLNVVLHAAGAVLLWRLLRKLSVPGALLAALVFAVHPVHVESVAWVTERKNVLSGVFYFSSMLAYLAFLDADQAAVRGKWRWYALALLLFGAALLSKTATCALPASILVAVWWRRGRLAFRDVLLVIPMMIAAAMAGAVTIYVEAGHTMGEAGGGDWSLNALGRILVAGRALWFYLGKLVWPRNLSFVYDRWSVDTTVWWQYLFPAAFAAVLAVFFFLRRRIGRGPLAAMLLFAFNLAPALGFLNVYYMRYSWVADHFLYLGSLGPIVLLSALCIVGLRLQQVGSPLLSSRQMARLAVPVAVVLALAALSWRQCRVFRDDETLWTHAIRTTPDAWMAHGNLAMLLIREGRFPEAEAALRSALRIRRDTAETHNCLGAVLQQMGRLDEAAAELREAVGLKPAHIEAHRNLAGVLRLQGKVAEATVHEAAATRLEGGSETHLVNGDALLFALKPREAVEEYRKALAVAPDSIAALTKLAWIEATHPDPTLRNGANAVKLAEQAAKATNHEHPLILDILAAAYAEAGRFPEAVATAEKSIAINPDAEAAVPTRERLQLFRAGKPFRASQK